MLQIIEQNSTQNHSFPLSFSKNINQSLQLFSDRYNKLMRFLFESFFSNELIHHVNNW